MRARKRERGLKFRRIRCGAGIELSFASTRKKTREHPPTGRAADRWDLGGFCDSGIVLTQYDGALSWNVMVSCLASTTAVVCWPTATADRCRNCLAGASRATRPTWPTRTRRFPFTKADLVQAARRRLITQCNARSESSWIGTARRRLRVASVGHAILLGIKLYGTRRLTMHLVAVDNPSSLERVCSRSSSRTASCSQPTTWVSPHPRDQEIDQSMLS